MQMRSSWGLLWTILIHIVCVKVHRQEHLNLLFIIIQLVMYQHEKFCTISISKDEASTCCKLSTLECTVKALCSHQPAGFKLQVGFTQRS